MLTSAAGTGYVSFEEFCTIVRKKISDDEEEREMRDMFRILDKEKRGEVNTDELRCATRSLYFLGGCAEKGWRERKQILKQESVRPRWPYDMRPSARAEKYMCVIVIR